MQQAALSQGLQDELSEAAVELIDEHQNSHSNHDQKGLIDRVSALLGGYKEDGFSHIQIKQVVSNLVSPQTV